MADKKEKFYACFVASGTKEPMRSVTTDWAKCEAMVKGKSGARYKVFATREEAERWLAQGAVYAPKTAAKPVRLQPGIYFDAGTGRGEGVEISVTDERGKNLLHQALSKKELNRFGKHFVENEAATNNYGELLALQYALRIAKKQKAKKIFGDSRLVIDHWSKWRIKRKELPEATVELADQVSKERETFEKAGGSVERISGASNPADLGFHRE